MIATAGITAVAGGIIMPSTTDRDIPGGAGPLPPALKFGAASACAAGAMFVLPEALDPALIATSLGALVPAVALLARDEVRRRRERRAHEHGAPARALASAAAQPSTET